MTFRLLALALVVGCASCATTKGVMPHAGAENGRSTAVHAAPGGAHPLNAQADAASGVTVSFRMPIYHDRFPLSGIPDTTSLLPTGYHRWEIGYSSMSKACRDSGLAWCRDIRNFGAWRPGAQIVPFRSGYAAPGQYVTVDSILVSSFSWPYALWGRAWTDVPGRWTYITERVSN